MKFFASRSFVLLLILPSLQASPAIFPLKDVKPGLKGECRTVFSGTQIQSFQFEVMGVVKDDVGPGRDVIWCKMTRDPTGQMVVAAGMSGSPCYIDGKNMGAVAYGPSFSKEPIFGVQPIESMLELLEFKGNERSAPRTPLGFPVSRSNASNSSSLISPFFKTPDDFKFSRTLLSGRASIQMMPLPLQVSGLHPLIADHVLQELSEAGFSPLATTGGGFSKAADAADLLPGSALTGVIATGDLNITVTGTLSWRDGNKILAFGHPFLGTGAANIPMGKAEIIGIVSSYSRSFKMSNPGKVVGTLTQDRISAVGGTIGLMPKMTPMVVKIRWPDSTRSYKLEFCDNKFFTPMVYRTALLEFLASVMESNEESTLKLKSEIQLEGLPPLCFEDTFAGERFSWVFGAVRPMLQQLLPLYQNDFDAPSIRKISVEAEIVPVLQKVTLEEITVDPLEAHSGDMIHIHAVFQSWHGKRFRRDYKIQLPEEMKDGETELVVADAQQADRLTGNPGSGSFFGGVPSSGSGLRNLEQLVVALNERHRSDRLYLILQKKSEGLYLQNQRLPALPQSVQKLLVNDPSADHPTAISNAILSKTQIDFDSVVEGSRSVKIKIK